MSSKINKKQVEDLTDAITSGLLQIPFHPLGYVKVLAQVKSFLSDENFYLKIS